MVQSTHNPKDFMPVETPIHAIKCPDAWSQLTEKEKSYAEALIKGSWDGCKVCWFQCSYESPALFVLFTLLFAKGVPESN